jgi:hypothetical protein
MYRPLLNRTHAAMYVMLAFFGAGLLALTAHTRPQQKNPVPPVPIRLKIMWIDHLDFLPGDPSVTTSFNAVSSGVGGGLSGLIIQSNTLGNTGTGGGNKVVEKGLQVPPGYLIKGVRICYELSNARTFFTQTRLDQVKDPPNQSIVLLDDATHLTNPGPVCVDSQSTTVDPSRGAVRLNFRINTGDTSDRIVLRAVGLHLQPHP